MSKINALNHHRNDGGLAFPGRRSEQVGNVSDHGFTFEGEDSPTYGDVEHPGMSFRDYAATSALQAAIAGHISHYGHDNHWHAADIASYAYEIADAMIAARSSSSSIQEKSDD